MDPVSYHSQEILERENKLAKMQRQPSTFSGNSPEGEMKSDQRTNECDTLGSSALVQLEKLTYYSSGPDENFSAVQAGFLSAVATHDQDEVNRISAHALADFHHPNELTETVALSENINPPRPGTPEPDDGTFPPQSPITNHQTRFSQPAFPLEASKLQPQTRNRYSAPPELGTFSRSPNSRLKPVRHTFVSETSPLKSNQRPSTSTSTGQRMSHHQGNRVSLGLKIPEIQSGFDAFVANDPFRPHTHVKPGIEAQDFDEVPLPEEEKRETFHNTFPSDYSTETLLTGCSDSSFEIIPSSHQIIQEGARNSSTAQWTVDEEFVPVDQDSLQQSASDAPNEDNGHAYVPFPQHSSDTPFRDGYYYAYPNHYSATQQAMNAGPQYNGVRPGYTYGPRNEDQRYGTSISILSPSQQKLREDAMQYFKGRILSQIYICLLLRLPLLYFSRVAHIFEEADLTLSQIKEMAYTTTVQDRPGFDRYDAFKSLPQYERLKSTWISFIDSVMREWKTFNIISVLLLSAILTILQIESAADEPLIRYSALLSLICALISLLFGCMYIIRFGSMRKTYKAAEWALEAQKTKAVIWWNVWVLLAMPAIWLTWSLILYITSIIFFIWLTSPQDSGLPIVMSRPAIILIRIAITIVIGIGLIFGVLILETFSQYGEVMDKTWKRRIDGWVAEKKNQAQASLYWNPSPKPTDRSRRKSYQSSDTSEVTHAASLSIKSTSSFVPPLEPTVPSVKTPSYLQYDEPYVESSNSSQIRNVTLVNTYLNTDTPMRTRLGSTPSNIIVLPTTLTPNAQFSLSE